MPSRVHSALAKAFAAVRLDAGTELDFRGGTVSAVVAQDLDDSPRAPGRPDFSTRQLARIEFSPTDPLPKPGETLEDPAALLRYRIKTVEVRTPHSVRVVAEVSPLL